MVKSFPQEHFILSPFKADFRRARGYCSPNISHTSGVATRDFFRAAFLTILAGELFRGLTASGSAWIFLRSTSSNKFLIGARFSGVSPPSISIYFLIRRTVFASQTGFPAGGCSTTSRIRRMPLIIEGG